MNELGLFTADSREALLTRGPDCIMCLIKRLWRWKLTQRYRVRKKKKERKIAEPIKQSRTWALSGT